MPAVESEEEEEEEEGEMVMDVGGESFAIEMDPAEVM
jgi:hypothetical protein